MASNILNWFALTCLLVLTTLSTACHRSIYVLQNWDNVCFFQHFVINHAKKTENSQLLAGIEAQAALVQGMQVPATLVVPPHGAFQPYDDNPMQPFSDNPMQPVYDNPMGATTVQPPLNAFQPVYDNDTHATPIQPPFESFQPLQSPSGLEVPDPCSRTLASARDMLKKKDEELKNAEVQQESLQRELEQMKKQPGMDEEQSLRLQLTHAFTHGMEQKKEIQQLKDVENKQKEEAQLWLTAAQTDSVSKLEDAAQKTEERLQSLLSEIQGVDSQIVNTSMPDSQIVTTLMPGANTPIQPPTEPPKTPLGDSWAEAH